MSPSSFLWIILIVIPNLHAFDMCDDPYCPQLSPTDVNEVDVRGPAPKFLGKDAASGCMCREYPRVFVVCFGGVLCKSVPSQINITAPLLRITSTHITDLRPGDFDGVPQLETLQVEANYNLSNVLAGTFNSNLVKLTNLSISFSPNLKYLHPKSFEGLVNLQTLYLVKNGFKNIYDVTQALSVSILPNLLKLSLNENHWRKVSSDDFKPMENSTLEELNLVLCRLEYIDPDCFVPLKHLEALRLGENIFNVSTISDVIQKIVEVKIPLRQLNLYCAGFRKNPPRELMEAVAKSNISRLNLARNQFEVISKDSFPYMPNLEFLDLREVLALDIEKKAFLNLPNLKTLLLSGNKMQGVPDDAIPSNLTHLDFQHNSGNLYHTAYFCLKASKFINMTKLVYLNLGFNKLSALHNTTFVGLENLQILGLKNGSIYHINNNSFVPLKNLIFLNLENNYFYLNNNPRGIELDVFNGLENLQVLLLGGCGITYFSLDGNPFVYLKNLKHLGLERNKIYALSPLSFAPLPELEFIDFSDNQLVPWQEKIFNKNKKLKAVILNRNRFTYLTESVLDDFTNTTLLELDGNPFLCDCQTYHSFNEWFSHRSINWASVSLRVKGFCAFPDAVQNYTLVEYFQSVQNGTILCKSMKTSKLLVVLPLVLLLLVFVVLAAAVHYYRWHIRYWIFLTRLYLSRKGKIKPVLEKRCYNNYMYDAFVSYSNEDKNFVVRLVSMLENYEPFLKLCVYDRDFQIGAMISESILESVAKSRRTLLIISDNYAKSQWCRWESQIAEHHRLFFEDHNGDFIDDTLLLVKLGPVNESHMTPTLRYLMKTRIYLQWEPDEKKQKAFWEKLRNTLAPPKDEESTSENTRM